MTDVQGNAVLTSLSFRWGVVGSRITQAMAQRVEPLGISHRQVGVLAVVDAGIASSQREIADALGVAPSLVVTLIDRLVALGAVTRERTKDRRVHAVVLTREGEALLTRAIKEVTELDATIRAALGDDVAALDRSLTGILFADPGNRVADLPTQAVGYQGSPAATAAARTRHRR